MPPRRLIVTAAALWALAFGFTMRAQQGGTAPAQSSASSPSTPAPANADCLACHEDDSAARADGRPVVVKPAIFDKSIHGSMACVDCHADLAKTAEFPHPEKLAKVDCSSCHSEVVEKYRTGVHAEARERGSSSAASCVDCHGTHDIRPASNPQSRTYHLNIAATCSRCHGDPTLTAKAGIAGDVAVAFADSIHGRALSRSGLTVAPTCSDCHGAHEILNPRNPKSSVATTHVPETCGKCHEGIALKFNAGIHGSVLAKGNTGAPACQTCHTAHNIRRADSTAWQLSVIGQCGTCHADRVATYRDTFHGQVTNLGFRAVAGCADCHGAHEILPASDARSPVAPANLRTTCGRCHGEVSANFVKYDPHADKHNRERSAVLYYASKFMTILLIGVFSFFGVHTSFWFTKEVHERRRRAVARTSPTTGQGVKPDERVPATDPKREGNAP